MLTQREPYGEFGPYIIFRHEDTGNELWRASMPYVPQPDSFIGHLEGGADVTTWYKVEKVKYEFEHAYGDSMSGGVPVPYIADSEYFGVCVLVSEV